MSCLTHLGTGVPETFVALLNLLESESALAGVAAPEGLSTFNDNDQVLDVVLDRKRRFLAIRGVYKSEAHLYVIEVFHVVPADGTPRIGLVASDAESLAVHRDTSTLVNYVLDKSPEVQGQLIPRFSELACLLLSDGDATLTSLDQRQQLAAQAADLLHQSLMLEDMAVELRRLRVKSHASALATSSKGVAALEAADPVFDDLDQLPDWAAANEDHIVILPRALAGAKKSKYLRPDLICKALSLLAGPYREHRSGRMSTQELTNLLMTEGFRIEGSVAPSIAGEHGDAYFVKWEGQRHFMDMHLLKGGGRDERYCLRIYFFWDAESRRVVCGELPAHLPNSLS